MGMNIYDSRGRHINAGSHFNYDMINQPLVTEKRNTYSFPFGDAEIVLIGFSGVFIVYGDLMLKHSERLRFKPTDDEPEMDLVELHFSLSGKGVMENYITGRKHIVQPNHHNMIYAPQFDGIGEYPSNERYRFFELHFTTEKFLELAKDSCRSLMQFADQVANNKIAELSQENMPISFAMHTCIKEIMECRFTGGLKLLFLQSKCVELLTLQAQAFEESEQQAPTRIIRSAYDIDCIHYAREYLLQHASQPPSLTELSRIAGINEFKLKKGFKEVYHYTVFGYLNDYRLQQSREMLTAGISIKDVADSLGYSSVQHFSNAFRKKFGIPPGKINK